MDAQVLPALARLGAALEAAQNVTRQIAHLLRQAEADAAALFRLADASAPTPPALQWETEGFDWWATAFTQQHGRAPTADDYAEFRLSWQLSGEGQGQWSDADWAAFYHAHRRRLDRWLAAGLITPPLTGTEILEVVTTLNDKELDFLIENDQDEKALVLALVAYEIDLTHINAITYVPDMFEEGVTKFERQIFIGPAAFQSRPWLQASLQHELVHVRQILEGRWYATDQGQYLNEVEAYDWELAHAQDYGLSAAAIAELRRRRNEEQYALLTPENQRLVDRGQYALPGEPLYQPPTPP